MPPPSGLQGSSLQQPFSSKRASLPRPISSLRRAQVKVFCQQPQQTQSGTQQPANAEIASQSYEAQPYLQQQQQQPMAPSFAQPQPQDGSTAIYAPPPGYPAGYPGLPQRNGQQEYYMQAPMQYYAPPPPPQYRQQEASSGAPWWIWVGVGVAAASIISKVQEFMKNPKTPQQMMTEMAMKQMMGAMGGGQPGGAAGPFGKAPGGMGMPPFPPGFPSPPGGFAQAMSAAAASPAVDVTPSSLGNNGDKKGEKFASRLGGMPGQGSPSDIGLGGNASNSSSGKESGGQSNSSSHSKAMDVVEPIVKEPASSRRSAGSSSSFFAGSSTQESSKQGAAASAPSSSSSSGSAEGSAQGAGAGKAAGASGNEATVMSEMMENMLRNPEMQKMLYPYLPEPMRNPQSIEWMLNNPEVKEQMAKMFEQQNMMSPEMMGMMKNMDFSQDKVNKQFQDLGLKPEDVITKVMANPELAAGFQNPKVQAAIIDISSNPMNIVKYQQDPEVMKVLEQVTTLFQPDIAASQR